ncbi:MAG: C40 family peptidase [Streptococcaceae bacterium]|jgi:cell wall-associated NlpC family hydrolase|nr:C40 family peptidase [Streptococcaceae bacterium]
MKLKSRLVILTGAVFLFLAVGMSVKADVAMYRLYNPNSGEHFYTESAFERDQTIKAGWNDEGTGWIAPDSGRPVYRLYNPNAGDHFYTLEAYEKDSLVALGWKYEGISWQSGGSVPLYRAYNPNAEAGSHNYTTSGAEQLNLTAVGWKDEGISWYGVGEGKPAPTPLSAEEDYYRNAAPKLTGSADPTVEAAINHGLGFVGKSPYNYGGGRTTASIAANQFDCSSFVAWMYALAGHSIDYQPTVTTYSLWNKGVAVSWENMQRGDLIIFNAPATSNAVVQTSVNGQVLYNKPAEAFGHVMMYLGDGFFLHDSVASSSGGVGIDRFSDVQKDIQYFTNQTWQQLVQSCDYTIRRVV